MFRKRKDNSAMDRTNVERTDRAMSADSQGDSMAGSEGIDEPSMHEHNRMSTGDRSGRQQGREGSTDDASDFSGMGGQRENSVDREGTGYTGNEGDLSGTGRTEKSRTSPSRAGRNRSDQSEDRSTTDQSESENPLT